MPIVQLTGDDYFQFAGAALKAVGRDIIAEGLDAARRTVADTGRVHRLLAVDGKRIEDLTQQEQILAAPLASLKMATVTEVDHLGNPTGNRLPAVEWPDEPLEHTEE